MFSSMYLRYQQMRKKLHCHYIYQYKFQDLKKNHKWALFFNDYKYL